MSSDKVCDNMGGKYKENGITKGPYMCTRKKGHSGKHRATYTDDEGEEVVLSKWD